MAHLLVLAASPVSQYFKEAPKMARYAIIENSIATNVVKAEPEFAASQGWIAAPAHVGLGWGYDNGTWSKPVAPIPTADEVNQERDHRIPSDFADDKYWPPLRKYPFAKRWPRPLYVFFRVGEMSVSLFSRFINAAFLRGSTYQTTSARCYIEQWEAAQKFIDALFFWQDNHCKWAWEREVQEAMKTLERAKSK